ncbi:hypothetical protein J2Y63_005393 [Shinella sp. BE166]|uniref:hypothetical protein n=1 Tax=Shinella sp. BE166 TaxID=3373918 RepID=UPI003EBB8153
MTPVAANDNSAWKPGQPVPRGYYRSTMHPDRIFRNKVDIRAEDIESEQSRFSDLAERRAWLATLPEKYKPVLAWPTAERLSRLESPDAARTLYRYAEMMSPPRMVVANDNEPQVAACEADPDMRHEFRPGENEMLSAASDGLRCAVVSERTASGWKVIERREAMFGLSENGFQLGNLLFRGGKLVSYGETHKGKRKLPAERTRQPKGYKAPPPRSDASIRFLLPSNDNTPIAEGAGWLGGITRPRGNGTRPDIGEHDAVVEMDRSARRSAVRLALGLDADVLDVAITDATAQQIGEAFGYEGKTAERQGIKRINVALKKLEQIAA